MLMRLEYFLQGLSYPCTIEWYCGEINDENFMGCKKYTFSEINDVINNFETVHFVTEFKRVLSVRHKIAIV